MGHGIFLYKKFDYKVEYDTVMEMTSTLYITVQVYRSLRESNKIYPTPICE